MRLRVCQDTTMEVLQLSGINSHKAFLMRFMVLFYRIEKFFVYLFTLANTLITLF